ncbi:MAG: hypothetical protein KDC06_12095, partial [Chitinophagaceae bacterium]|nr:hypothetical protein [Chitinophagaceae bacterium]
MKILLSILIIAFTFSVNAQETGSKQKGTLSFNWGKWRLDGKRIQLREVKNEILKVEKANFYFKRSRANLTTAYLATIPTVAFILLGKQNQNPASPNFGKSRAGFSIAG